MTSERAQSAARANGRAGRGRKSAAGKAASAQNAFRHGLSVPLMSDPAASAEIAALARMIAPRLGAGAPGEAARELGELARRIAEAQLDLARVRRARHDLIAAALSGNDDASSRIAADRARVLEIVTAFAQRQGALSESLLGHIAARQRSAGADTLAQTLGDLAPRLAAMDRYERRARSRRMRAIQAYDHKKAYLMFAQSNVVVGRTKLNSDSHRREGGG